MAVFAVVTLAMAVFGDVVGLVLGVGLGAAAYNELRGAAMLRRFEPRAARRLGYNQLGLGVLIVAYAAWSLIAALRSPSIVPGGSTGDPNVDAMIGQLAGPLTYGLYGGVAALGIIAPGLTAWYYFSRARVVNAMVSNTPPWVIEAMRAAG